ncbi:hypothetical protein NQD34_002632 [Periophthalmus magnuspinnatus]|nr:hypothetical protein NQD34_002632 [Periophthalmus magnuspinnatus]
MRNIITMNNEINKISVCSFYNLQKDSVEMLHLTQSGSVPRGLPVVNFDSVENLTQDMTFSSTSCSTIATQGSFLLLATTYWKSNEIESLKYTSKSLCNSSRRANVVQCPP